MRNLFCLALLLLSDIACQTKKLPYLGEPDIINKMVEGKEMNQTKTIVVLETNQGVIEVALMPETAPKACENFLGLVNKHYYDGISFHRVIKNFMIQGGDPITKTDNVSAYGTGGPGYAFADELNPNTASYKTGYVRGTVAMANSGPNTNGSQFFITTVPTPWLNMKHTIFGEVTSGYEIVEAMENTATGGQDRPVKEQKIIKASVE